MKQDFQDTSDAPIRQIGRVLMQNREAKGMSLADVEVHLKVRTAKIRAIEEGNLAELPGMVFTKGFIRNYARLLQVEDEIAPLLVQLDGEHKAKAAAAAPAPQTPPLPPPKGFPAWLKLLIPLVLIALGVMWWQGKSVRQVEEQTRQEAVLDKLPEAPAVAHENVLIVPMPQESGANAAASTDTEAASDNIKPDSAQSRETTSGSVAAAAPQDNVLNISVRYRSFLSVRDAEDKVLINRIVPGGSSHQFSGIPPYNVRIGYALGSTVEMNGETYNLADYTRDKTATLTVPNAR